MVLEENKKIKPSLQRKHNRLYAKSGRTAGKYIVTKKRQIYSSEKTGDSATYDRFGMCNLMMHNASLGKADIQDNCILFYKKFSETGRAKSFLKF